MSDRGDRSGSEDRKSPDRNGRKDRSASKSRSRSPRARSYSKSRSRSRSRSYSRSKSRSRSPRRSRSGSRSRHSRSKRYSRSRSRSPYYKRRSSPYQRRRRHYGSRDDPPKSNCLGIFGLSLYTTERDLKDFIDKYGTVSSCQLVYDHQSGRSRGFAFAYFPDPDEAEKVKEETNGLELDGRRIRVDYSITQRAHTPTPGVYMGKPSQFRNRRDDFGGGGGRSRDYDRRDRDYDRRDRYDRDYNSRSRSRSPRRY